MLQFFVNNHFAANNKKLPYNSRYFLQFSLVPVLFDNKMHMCI